MKVHFTGRKVLGAQCRLMLEGEVELTPDITEAQVAFSVLGSHIYTPAKGRTMSKITELNYKQLIFRIQRPTHDEHSQALCEAERRIAKGCKRAATQEALVAAVNAARLGAPVPHARTTRRT